MVINLLLEISPILPDGSIQTLHLASRGVGPSGTQFNDGYQWLPLITQQFSRTVSWSDEGVLGETTVSYTPIVFEVSDDIGVENEHWSTWQWAGAYCRVWRGDEGLPFSAYTQIYEGSAGAIERNGVSASLPLLSIDHLVDRNLLTRTYGGTNPAGGPEGPSSLRGVLKPYAAGVCANVEPILVDRVAMIYQHHGYGPTRSVDAVYENALSLGDPVTIVSTWTDLAALKLPNGSWAAAPKIGAFRLANQPTGKITADVSGALDGATFPTTVGGIMAMMIKATGVSADRVAASLGSRAESYSFYTTDQTVVGDELRAALLACGCASMPSRDGKYAALDFYALNTNPIRFNSDIDVMPVVRSYRQLNVAPPIWQVKVSGDRCWSTHSETEISQAVAVISAEFEANAQAIKDAKEAAALAIAQADTQKKRVDEILSDQMLDRGEKARENATFESESAIKVEIMDKSTIFDVTAPRAKYLAAYNNLAFYLNSLDPSFFDLSQTTPITNAYREFWNAYYLAKVELANAMTGNIKTILDDTKEAVDGVKTEVGVVKETLEAVKGDVATARETLSNRVESILLTPLEKISALHIAGSTANLKASKALSDKNALAVSTLETKVDETGKITSEQITQLTSRVKTGEETVEAGFLEVNRTIADTKEALAESVVLTIAKFGESVSASMVEERRVRSTEDKALAESIDQMAVDLTTDFGDKLTGQINDVKKIIADEDGIIGTRIEELGVKLVEDVAGEKLEREAAIKVVEQTIIDTDGVTAGRVDTISSRYDDLSKYAGDIADSVNGVNGRVDSVEGVIQVNQETSAKADEARAEETRALKAQLDTMNYAQLEQDFTTYASKVDGIGAEYTLKVQTTTDGTKVVAGMGIAVENGVSAVNFLADSFRISVPGIAPTKVFEADAQGVYMPNVRADNIKAGAIDFEFVAKQSLRNVDGGYQFLPGGLVMMWGRYRNTIRGEVTLSVVFPVPFPTMCMSFTATPYITTANYRKDLWIQNTGTPSPQGATVYTQAATGDDQSLDGFDWMAFGY